MIYWGSIAEIYAKQLIKNTVINKMYIRIMQKHGGEVFHYPRSEVSTLYQLWFFLHVEKLSAPITPTTSKAVPAPTRPGTYRYHAPSKSSVLRALCGTATTCLPCIPSRWVCRRRG